MQVADIFPAFRIATDKALDRLDGLIYKGKTMCDGNCSTFYTFKPYPKSLKASQIDEWARLQCRVLSPFVDGDQYHYLHPKGLCFWSSMAALEGVPETAMQQLLSDGEHIAKGLSSFYRQRWQNGVLISCELVDNLSSSEQQTATQLSLLSTGWARTRNIDPWLSAPVTWAVLAIAIASIIGLGLFAGYLTMQVQLSSLSEQQASIEQKLGDKLTQQNELQQLNAVETNLVQWQYANGLLPQALAALVDVATSQVEWETTLILWQDRTLTVELMTEQLDIAKLVTELEASKSFSNVSVRPSSRANTWQIEVTVNDNR
jgi:hypothetical protein